MPAPVKIDLGKAIKLRFVNGLSEPDIGKHFQVSKQAINNALKPFSNILQDNEVLKEYHANYTNVLRNANMVLMQGLFDPKKMEGASLNNVAYAFNTVANHLRLEENKSTDNVGFKGIIDHIKKSADDLDTMKEAIFSQASSEY